jgi:hypothetical protein
MSNGSSAHPHRPSPAAIVLIPLVAALVLTLFAWPSARLEPRDLPIGVGGPARVAGAIEKPLSAQEGAFDVHRYPSGPAARRAIEDREVYGAFVVTPAGPKALVASAARPAVAQLITHAAEEQTMPVEDVVSATPAGTALASSVLPLVIAGILAGIAAATLASSGLGRAGLLVAASVLTGLVATLIVQGWLDIVEGDWALNAAALGLTVLAIGSVVAGFGALLGKAGRALAALAMILIGNPFSGMGSAPEMLPEPAGAIGQLMPPGAGGNLLRSTGFFDGAAAGGHIAVLAVWTLVGLAALFAAAARERAAAPATTRRLARA